MEENKDMKKEQELKDKKPLTKPGDIKGKIEVPDTRERRDGPGETEADINIKTTSARKLPAEAFSITRHYRCQGLHLHEFANCVNEGLF